MKTTMLARACATALLAAAALPAAHAVDFTPDGVSLQAGGGEGTGMAGVGIIWNWNFEALRRAELTAHTELMLNGWHADAVDGGHRNYAQVVLLPTLRMRLDRGASPWFFELGVGPSYLNKHFQTPDKEFGTQWNFYDVLGAGYTLGGPQGKQEIGLRLAHISNAGIRKPNPGQDFLQLRYVHWF
jgi:lipid A 3-O-deacylase